MARLRFALKHSSWYMIPFAALGLTVGGDVGFRHIDAAIHDTWIALTLYLLRGFALAISVGLILGFLIGCIIRLATYRSTQD
jgi:hypothetical protein